MNNRIIIVTSEFPPQPGGIGNHAYNLALHLNKAGKDVTVIADMRSSAGSVEKEFDETLPFKIIRTHTTKPRFLIYFKRFYSTLKTIKNADCVIATGKFSLWNVAICRFFRKFKNVAIIHGSEVNFTSIMLKKSVDFSLKRFDKIIAVSNYTKNLVSHLKKEVVVIPNGIDLNKWSNKLKKQTNNDSFQLITVGRISERKGQHLVAEHIPRWLKTYPNLIYHCVGLNNTKELLQNRIDKLNISNHVVIHGVLSDEDLQLKLADSDIFMMLSTQTNTGDTEGFGIALLEANAMKIPVIGARGSGIEDAINNGKSGFLVDPKNHVEIDKAIVNIMNDYNDFSNNAFSWAQIHQWSIIIKKYLKALE